MDNWMSRECGTHGKERKVYTILVENLKIKVLFEDLGANWRILYNIYLKKQEERAWNGIVRPETHQYRHRLNMEMKYLLLSG